MNKIIDADLVQEQQRAPYTFRGMTIREVPINENPCTEDRCEGYRWSNCPGESWACPEYQKFRSLSDLKADVQRIKERMNGIKNMPVVEKED
jgi:hypothetical protein